MDVAGFSGSPLAALVRPGVTAVIGSGGKTTLLTALAHCLPGHILLCTTTHFFPFPGIPLYTGSDASELHALFRKHAVICAGSPSENGKLTASAIPLTRLAGLADYVLVEADGSRGLPLKAHAAWEPALPDCRSAVLLVAGASGFDRPINSVVHRPELFAARCGAFPEENASPERIAAVWRSEGLAHYPILVNQAENHAAYLAASRLARSLGCTVLAGSARNLDFHVIPPSNPSGISAQNS